MNRYFTHTYFGVNTQFQKPAIISCTTPRFPVVSIQYYIVHFQILLYCRNAEEPVTDIKSPHYNGQVHLCPPKDFRTSKCSVSTGLVLIWTYQEWRGINQNSSSFPLSSHVADSICRQLGFTNAVVNSAVTLNSTSLNYSHCYDG